MSEMIKREDAIKITWQEPQYYDPINVLTEVREKIRALPITEVRERIEALPTVDSVEVVRCKDCKHRPIVPDRYEDGFDLEFPDGICPCQCDDAFYSYVPNDNWFCANGERRE